MRDNLQLLKEENFFVVTFGAINVNRFFLELADDNVYESKKERHI
jgi:hypothetical protein